MVGALLSLVGLALLVLQKQPSLPLTVAKSSLSLSEGETLVKCDGQAWYSLSCQPTPRPTTASPTKPSARPTPRPSISFTPTFTLGSCNAVGPVGCESVNLVAVSSSGYVYTGWKGTIAAPKTGDGVASTGNIYYSTDGGDTFALHPGSKYCGSSSSGTGTGLGGIAAGEDSTYSYLWVVCNPTRVVTQASRTTRASISGDLRVVVCYSLLKSTTFTCRSDDRNIAFFESKFTSVRAVSASSDGKTAGIVGQEAALLTCTYAYVEFGRNSGISCTYKSSAKFASVAFDSAGSNIIAAPDTGFYLSYGSVSQADTTWKTTAKLSGPSSVAASWSACVASDSFAKLICAQYGGYTYASKDSGATWTASDSTYFFTSLSMTQSGSTVLAGSSYSAPYIALSTDGLTWQSQSGCQAALPTNAVAIKSKKSYYSARAVSISKFWASSGWGMSTYYWYENCYTSVTKVDGKDKYVGTTGTQSLYKSSTTYTAADGGSDDDASAIIVSPSDYNSTFTVTTSTEFVWSEFSKSKSASYSNSAVSSDGTVIVGAIGEGGLEISVDSGDTWTTSTAAGKHVDWSDVITSSDGSYIFAVTHGGSVYASNDYGVTLTEASVPVEDDFISVKCSR